MKITIYPILWDTVKVLLRGKFIALNAYIIKEESTQVYNPSLYLTRPEKEQNKTKARTKKGIIKSRNK